MSGGLWDLVGTARRPPAGARPLGDMAAAYLGAAENEATPVGLAPGQPQVDPRRDGSVQPTAAGKQLSGAIGGIAGGVVHGLLDAAKLPGDVYAGRIDPMSDQAIGRAFDLAGSLATGGMPLAEPGAAGIFGGRLAATADREALKRAESMAAGGADRRAIWDETGWFQGPDTKWRFEIADDKAGLRRAAKGDFEAPQGGTVGGTGSQFAHPDLYAAYPSAGKMPLELWQAFPGEPHLMEGIYHGQQGGIWGRAGSTDSANSLTLHELQHHVQEAEGFARGSNPKAFTREMWAQEQMAPLEAEVRALTELYPDAGAAVRLRNDTRAALERDHGADWRNRAPDHLLEAMDEAEAGVSLTSGAHDLAAARAAHDKKARFVADDDMARFSVPMWQAEQYRRTAGEVEAFNVQARRHMTPEERRARPPWETQEVPDDRQVVLAPLSQSLDTLAEAYRRR